LAKKVLFLCILFCLLAAAAGPKVVSAGVDPLASPTPRPTERITAPVISGVNPDALLSEGNLGDTHPSGSFIPVGISLPILVDPPLYVDLKSQPATQANLILDQPRNINDVNCGPASLAQALQILDPEGITPPLTTRQLSDYLVTRGLMYDWGTGVEELAYTAREFGYDGSISFQNWNLEQLTDYLYQGRPVVVSLGMNGADNPGHFVTLTGISEDGKWITCQDPVAGELILSEMEFLSLWQMQGSAGMIPQKGSSAMLADPMLPWMGLFGAISALALTLNQSGGWRESRAFSLLRKQLSNPRRKGIGGGPLPPPEPEVIQIPRYETKTVYRGINTVEEEVPVYETRKVKVGIRGIKKKVPQYETRRVQVGEESVTKRVPVYSTKKVQTGTRLVKKKIPVTRYRTKKVMVWKKYTKRVPVYRYKRSKKFVIGYKNETRWKRVPVTRQVPYQNTKTISIQVPVYRNVRVISGYKTVTKKVPRFELTQVLAGHKIINETVPVYEERQIQVGTKTVTRQIPQYETVRIPIINDKAPSKEPNASDGDSSSPPTGFSAEIWNSLSAEDQKKVKLGQIKKSENTEEKWWHDVLRKLKTGIVDPIIELREHPDEVLKIIDVKKLPKILSLSAKSSWDINIFSQEGMVLSTKTPPGLWQIFFMTQKFNIEQKSIVTVNPGSLINYYFTSGTGSVKITKNLSYIFGPSEWGISIKKEPSNGIFDYSLSKHMINISGNGISYKWKEEDTFIDKENSTDKFQIKLTTTRKCETKTIKTEGLLVVLLGVVLAYQIASALVTFGFVESLVAGSSGN